MGLEGVLYNMDPSLLVRTFFLSFSGSVPLQISFFPAVFESVESVLGVFAEFLAIVPAPAMTPSFPGNRAPFVLFRCSSFP